MKRLASLLVGLLLSAHALAGNYIGDYTLGDTVDCNFGTVRPSTGASFTLAGSPVISAYIDNSTTQLTAGITLTADFDSVTGMNHVRVVASGGNGYTAGTFVSLVITTGTVDSVSVTGQEVCSFTLNKVSDLRFNTTCTGTSSVLGISDCGTAQGGSGTTLQLRSAANFTSDSRIVGNTCFITGGTGFGESLSVASYVNSTDTATMSGTWPTTPDNTSTYTCFGTAPAGGSVSIASGGIVAASFATDSITNNAIATDAIGAAELAANAVGSSELATDAIGATEIADGAIDAATLATDTITAAKIATDAIGAAELASDAGTELGTANWSTTTRILTAGTNIALAKGTGVTGFNDLSAAQVNTEADTALSDIFLDRMFSTAYNPASKPGSATALMNVLVESDAGVPRFTANSLEQAPTGGGASAVAIADEVQTRTIAAVTSVASLGNNAITAAAIAPDAGTEIATAVRDIVVDDISGKSLGCILAAVGAYTGGQVTTSGGVSTYRDQSGVEVRISGTVSSSGNRTATITCPSY